MVVSSLKRCVLRTAAAMSAVVVGRQTADGPTDIGFGRTERQQQPLAYVPTTIHTFDAVCLLRTDMRRDAYKFVHPHLMRSYVGPL